MNQQPTAGIFTGLQAEWTALCEDVAVQSAVADWLITDGLADEVAAVTECWVRGLGPRQILAAVALRGGAVADGLADAVLRALLRRAAGHGRSATLAARIVVQAMLPAALRMTRGQVRSFGGRSYNDVGHMVIVALFELARSGRIHQRPGRPSANLALDALSRVCRELAADHEPAGEALSVDVTDTALGPVALAHAREVQAAAAAAGLEAAPVTAEEVDTARLELLELLLDAMEAGHLPADDARTISTYYSDCSIPDPEAAAAAGVSQPAWRRRRSRAVGRLRYAVAHPSAA